MRKVTVYSMEVCASCDQVKSILDARDIPYEEVVMDPDSADFDELAQRSGMTTLPQVYVGSILVGGGIQTITAAHNGMLADLLED
jgi:glutaredoxin 3